MRLYVVKIVWDVQTIQPVPTVKNSFPTFMKLLDIVMMSVRSTRLNLAKQVRINFAKNANHPS